MLSKNPMIFNRRNIRKKCKRKTKLAMSVGYAWIFGLVSLFGLGVMYVVFSNVFSANLVPIIKDQLNTSYAASQASGTGQFSYATYQEVNNGIDRYMSYFKIVPFVLFFAVIVFMIVAAFRRDTDSEQF